MKHIIDVQSESQFNQSHYENTFQRVILAEKAQEILRRYGFKNTINIGGYKF
ncbi:MAG: hypothetical protein ACI870_000621 [Crocinitomicaceae bacterium]|jgi:hypothetical protein